MNVHGALLRDDEETRMAQDPARRATIRDVAVSAGVSAQTVSRVINGSSQVRPGTRAQVLRSIAELGYSPDEAAQNLARLKRAPSVGSAS